MKNNLQDLVTLDDLLKKGIISEEEFNSAKDKILNKSNAGDTGNLFGLNENTYSFLIHISVLLGFVHFLIGFIVPVVLWTLNRENSKTIDQHGKNVLNWILSFAIYSVIATLILFPMNSFMQVPISFSYNLNLLPSLFTAFFPVVVLMIINILFILIGGLKASTGVIWKYPLSIRFFKN